MLEIPLLVGSLALADAINPVTIAVALYLASAQRPQRPHARVAAFTGGVITAYGLGGAALLLGPGRLLASAASSADTRAFHTASVIAGAALVIAALVIMRRGATAGVTAAVDRLSPRSAFALGASVTVLDLPTAFPYFAAIAAVANSGAALPAQLGLLGAFNLIYVSPLLAIAALPTLAGHRWRAMAIRGRRAVDRFAAAAVAALTGLMGGALILRGAGGLLG